MWRPGSSLRCSHTRHLSSNFFGLQERIKQRAGRFIRAHLSLFSLWYAWACLKSAVLLFFARSGKPPRGLESVGPWPASPAACDEGTRLLVCGATSIAPACSKRGVRFDLSAMDGYPNIKHTRTHAHIKTPKTERCRSYVTATLFFFDGHVENNGPCR